MTKLLGKNVINIIWDYHHTLVLKLGFIRDKIDDFKIDKNTLNDILARYNEIELKLDSILTHLESYKEEKYNKEHLNV